MGKWSQYRVRYEAEWEKEDGLRGELSRRICCMLHQIVESN